MDSNLIGRAGGGWLSYEKLYPIAVAYCCIMIAVWIPITITNSSIIHNPETSHILSGRAANDMANANTVASRKLENRIHELKKGQDFKGSRGAKGQDGDQGEKGTNGDQGISGNKGRKGYNGSKGVKGNEGVKGDKGEPGDVGQRGNSTGDPGPQGQKGQKGEKGDGPPLPSPPMVFNISGSKGDVKMFQVFCIGTCRDVSIDLRYQGDADLFANEGSPPRVNSQNADCNDCLCKARSSGSRDTCIVTTSGVNNFYTAVYAHKDYSNGRLTFDGPNFQNATTDDDDSLTMTTTHDGSGTTTMARDES